MRKYFFDEENTEHFILSINPKVGVFTSSIRGYFSTDAI